MFASIIDGDALLQVLWVSAVSGIGLTLVFSLAIAGGARAGQARRAGGRGATIGWYAFTAVCGVLCVGAVVLAVTVMLSK